MTRRQTSVATGSSDARSVRTGEWSSPNLPMKDVESEAGRARVNCPPFEYAVRVHGDSARERPTIVVIYKLGII